MKAINIMLGLIIGITTVTLAQEADSIVVTYDNQRTIIPVPAFGKQTTIKMADSVQMIEIRVSRRKISDIKQSAQYPSSAVTAEKPLKKVKWYSQIEAGYNVEFSPNKINQSIIDRANNQGVELDINPDNLRGYKVGLSVYDKEKIINNRFSYVSGFKVGFAQSFRKDKSMSTNNDTIISEILIGYNGLTVSRIQFLFPFGFRYHFPSKQKSSRMNFGANIGSSLEYNTTKFGEDSYSSYGGAPILIQPFWGIEIGKIGLLISSDLSIKPNYALHENYTTLNVSLGLSLTYRFY